MGDAACINKQEERAAFLAVAAFSLHFIYRQQKKHILFTVPVVVVKASFVPCLPNLCVSVCMCVEWRRYSKGGVGAVIQVVVAFSCWV